MDELEERIKKVLMEERERIESSPLERKLKEIRQLHEERRLLGARIDKLSIEIRDMKYEEDRQWNFKGKRIDKQEKQEEERLSIFAI